MDDYGKELILDLVHCDANRFTRKSIRAYFKKVCTLIDMERGKLCWWDDLYTPEEEKETELHLVGTSAVQFIKTSNITVHALSMLEKVYVNVFSCKDFNEYDVVMLSEEWFAGEAVHEQVVRRM